ncbi:unnamed protein product [Protopolystoma xenopodis]|uniref:Uncharacterized protein n=1 Tax=Protopolystoma xenopodis TaxID=117903 RepID=A0A448WX41_9PLAT|nr:unnamed protein product [Protopolystoma xenopodis]
MADKPSLCRDSTMALTVKAGKEFLAGEKLGDVRAITNQLKKSEQSFKRSTTVDKTIAEARILLGKDFKLADTTTGRTLRDRAPKPVSVTPIGSKRGIKGKKVQGVKKAKLIDADPLDDYFSD